MKILDCYHIIYFIFTFLGLKYLMIGLCRVNSSKTFDGVNLSGDRLSVQVPGEDDPLQLGEMIVLHQPGCCLDI